MVTPAGLCGSVLYETIRVKVSVRVWFGYLQNPHLHYMLLRLEYRSGRLL